MSGLTKRKDSNYNLMSEREQTTLANSLNTFYTRFNTYTPPVTVADRDVGDDGMLPSVDAKPDAENIAAAAAELPPEFAVDEVRKQPQRCKVGKASGPDNLCIRILKACAYELAPTFFKLF